MNWFFIAIFSPILYSITNHTDKYLISKYLEDKGVGSLIIFSALFGIVALPIIFLFDQSVLAINFYQGIILTVTGILSVLSILLYLYALRYDDVSSVVPYYQTIPIFGYILGYFILGEILLRNQIIGSIIILIGVLVISLDYTPEKKLFKKQVAILMLIASLSYAISDVLFKLVAIKEGYVTSIFWSLVGKIILGTFFLIFIGNYRQSFFSLLKIAKLKIYFLNSINETLTIFADLISQYAVLLAPVALVLLVNGLQPLFVFIISVLISIFLPKISNEDLSKKIVLKKTFGIIIILIGTYLIK